MTKPVNPIPAAVPKRGMDYTPQQGGPPDVSYGLAPRVKAGRRQTVHEIVDRRLSNFEAGGLPPLVGRPTCCRHDLLLPPRAPDHCSTYRGLCDHFEDQALPLQVDLVGILTLRFGDHKLRHVAWEQARAFVASMIVRERRLPAILALHRPGIAGRALPAHVHAVIFLREL